MPDVYNADLIARLRHEFEPSNQFAKAALETVAGVAADALESAKTTLDYDRDYIKSLELKIAALEAVPVETQIQDKPWLDPRTGARFSKQNNLTLGYVYSPVEPDWEYGVGYPGRSGISQSLIGGLKMAAENSARFGDGNIYRRIKAVAPGPWLPAEPVQVDPQPHYSGSCPNGGGYSCTNHEPHDSGQVTEGGTQ